jgi:hypothetical protein
MAEGMTCYERDEELCEDGMCLRTGCRLRNARLSTDRQVEALADCPFCGGRLFRREYLVIEGVIGCRTCGATITRKHQPECDDGLQRAAEAWNTRYRTPSAPDVAMREALSNMLYYAEEWYRHIGSDATLSDDSKEEIEQAKAALQSQAKATEGKAGMAGVTDTVRRSTAGTGLLVGEADAVQPATSEIMDVTAGETAPTPPQVDREAVARKIVEFAREGFPSIRLTRDFGPYEITEPTPAAFEFAYAILSLLAPTAPAQEGE